MSEALHQAVGELRGRLTALENEMSEHKATMDTRLSTIDRKLDNIADILAQGKGGWRALAWVTGAIATVAGAVAWLVSNLNIKLHP